MTETKTTKNIQVIALTGGPCAGKTTAASYIQNYMTKLGWYVIFVDEAATQQISNGFLPTMMSETDFQSMIINTQYQKEEIAKQAAEHITGYDNILIVCDRGICDNQAYMSNSTYLRLIQKYFNTTKSEVMGRYGAVFHLVTAADGAEEFYTLGNNSARSETPEQARELDRNTRNCWIGHPHLRIIKNDCNFEQKLQNLLKEISQFLGVPQPYEVERKFLIKMPKLKKLEALPNCQRVEIVQTYLQNEDEFERRIRQRGFDGGYIYTETTKHPTPDPAIRIETERRLTQSEYLDLMMQADPALQTVRKTRYCLDGPDGKYLELDVYPFWKNQAILEVELVDAQDEIQFPDFITVIREVTDDDSYKNHALAASVPSEES